MLRFIILLSFVSIVKGQAEAPPGGCLVCGDGKVVTAPDAIFSFPNQPAIPCGQLQEVGLAGVIDATNCAFIPNLSEMVACECAPGSLPTVSPAPVSPAPVSPAPVSPAPVSPAPVSPAPVTPAPVTPAPVTPAPLAPVSQAPVTLAPVSPPPASSAPITLAPVSPAPVTPVPVTSAPITPAPVTPAPVTPAPLDPVSQAPVTLAPVSPAPISPPPASSAPITLAPVSPAPVSRSPVSPAPMAPVSPVAPTLRPSGALYPCPDVPTNGCSICGEGLCVNNLYAIFSQPGQPDSGCLFLEKSGLRGELSATECSTLPPIVATTCSCDSGTSSEAP